MKKHILFIVENVAAPLDRRVWPEAAVAKESFERVTVISPASKRFSKKHEIINGIEIYRHPLPKFANKTISFLLEYLVAFLYEFVLSIKIILKNPFHVIHAANPPDHIFLIALFYKLFGIKFIFDHHDLSPELYLTKFSGKKNTLYKILFLCEKLACKLADAVISANNSYKQIVIKRHKINRDKTFVVRNDPKISEFLEKKDNPFTESNDKKNILYLGGINYQDGVDRLLYILKYLIIELKRTDFICYVVGGGEALRKVKNMCKKLNLNEFVTFKGAIYDRRKVINHLYSADICVEPAPANELNRHSTFIKIMEYMAAGKPVVAFDLYETRFSTNNSAILIKPGDIEGFAKAIKQLMDDPGLREKLGSSGLARIQNELNWENAAISLKSAYDFLNV